MLFPGHPMPNEIAARLQGKNSHSGFHLKRDITLLPNLDLLLPVGRESCYIRQSSQENQQQNHTIENPSCPTCFILPQMSRRSKITIELSTGVPPVLLLRRFANVLDKRS